MSPSRLVTAAAPSRQLCGGTIRNEQSRLSTTLDVPLNLRTYQEALFFAGTGRPRSSH